MTPDQLLLAGSGALGLALWLRRNRSQAEYAEAIPPPLGPRGPIYDLLHPMREPVPIGNSKFDMYEQHVDFRAMSGGFKALDLNTPLPTLTGWTTVGEVREGDYLFDECGRQTRVLGTSEVFEDRPCYEVVFSDGASIVADAEHRWLTVSEAARRSAYQAKRNNHRQRITPSVVTTAEIAATLYVERSGRKTLNHAVPVAGPLDCPAAPLPVHPYVLGTWLADGDSHGGRITTPDTEVVEMVGATGQRVTAQQVAAGKCPNYGLPGLSAQLRELGVWGDKHIPVQYLRASYHQRLSLLRGLMDGDGCCHEDGQSVYVTTRRRLADGVLALVSSLGIKAGLYPYPCAGRTAETSMSYRVTFTTDVPVFRLPRKAERLPTTLRATSRYRYISDVRPVATRPTRCLMVDSASRLFLAGREGIPTHNTTVMAQIARERIKAGRAVVVLTGGDSDQLEEEIRAWGGWVIRPHDSPLKFNAFEGRASYMAQGWAGLFPTNTDAKVYHSAFEIAAIRYFQTHSSYSVRGLMNFMLAYDPDKDAVNQIETEDGEVVQKLNGRLWKGMREGYVGIRLQLMEMAFGDWIGDELSVLHCVKQRIPIMFVLDSADDPDLNRFACALVWQAINYAVREHGKLDAFVDELGRLPPNLVGNQVRTWRRNKCHLLVGSHADEDFSSILEDLIHVHLLGQMVSSATATRKGASEKTWGTVHPTNFGPHVLGQEWTVAHSWLRRPRQGKFWMTTKERVQQVTVTEYSPPKERVPRWSLYHLNASAKRAVPLQTTSPATEKTGGGAGYVVDDKPVLYQQVAVPVSPGQVAGDLGTGVAQEPVSVSESLLHGPVASPRWIELDAHTRKLAQRLYYTGPPLDPRTCQRIRLALKGKGKRPGFQWKPEGSKAQPQDWLIYDFVQAVTYAMEQGYDGDELNHFLSYVKLKLVTQELSVDHLCEKWMGTQAKLCVRPEHLGWERVPDNTDLHWERWWQDRRERQRSKEGIAV